MRWFKRQKERSEETVTQNAMGESHECRDLEKLALLAYRLFGEGLVDFHRLRYEFVTSPLFAHIKGDWFVKSIGYVILSTDVLEKRGDKYYIKEKWLKRIPELMRKCGD